MNIDELNKELDSFKSRIKSARKLQTELDNREDELLKIIKEEMSKRGINAIKIDFNGVDIGDWNLMYLYDDDDYRELASTVYIDEQDDIQFVAEFNQDGFTDIVISPYCNTTKTPTIVYSVGAIDFEAAKPYNQFGDYDPDHGIITANPYDNGVLHLARIFGKCIKLYDTIVKDKV